MHTCKNLALINNRMSAANKLDNDIRKLRKKLRQIENLERLNRPLSGEEIIKLNSKDKVRDKLLAALDEHQPVNENDNCQDVESGSQDSSGDLSEEVRHSAIDQVLQGDSVLDQQKKEKTLTSENDKSTEKRNQAQKRDQGDKKKQEPKAKKVRPQLSESYCRVSYLEGHNDLITSLVVIGDKLVTASRDTTLKCWDITHGTELRNYGGHTGTVTCLLVLEHVDEPALPEDDRLLISGSVDSTFKLWSLNTGQMLKSVYTYNPVTNVAYCFPTRSFITSSDGGKLELWDLATGTNCFSSRVHDASVTGLKVSHNSVYSSASDGVIKLHRVTEDNQLTCLFVSETLKTSLGNPLITRHIRCLAVCSDILFFGDDARNVKVLDWKKGLVTKLANHTNNFTSTDALSCHGDFLLSSSYDLDLGLGYINVRSSKTLEYLATIDDENTERIVCLDFGHSSSNTFFVVTGGMDLKLWEVLPAEAASKRAELPEEEDIFKLEFRSALAKPAVDSETEASSDDDDSESDSVSGDGRLGSGKSGQDRSGSDGSGWLSWCSVL